MVLLGGIMASGQEYSNKVAVSNVEFVMDGEDLLIQMDMDFSKIVPETAEQRNYTLVIYDDANHVILPVASLLSRSWFYHYAREKRDSDPFDEEDHVWYYKKAPKPFHYVATVAYREWMGGARMRIDAEVGGCCGKPGEEKVGEPIESASFPVPDPEPVRPVYSPEFIYVLPPAETTVKQRDISGEAYVVFASGKTEVDPAYKNNQVELDKIRATIDSVRLDPDVTITQVALTGYSSPDGKYQSNEKLSIARTQAIKDYVSGLDSMDENIFTTDAVAENWDGLRAAVEASDIAAKDKILAVIDSDLAPDKKEAKLKANYGKQWKVLARDVFPMLRRTNYRVSYTVKSYTTTEDARRILRTDPSKLSITEFFLAAKGYAMGTREFDDVFAIAARVYPENEVVNINAANAAMSLGNMQSAKKYLERLGESPVAAYTKGVCCALEEDWKGAVMYFTLAQASGVKEASGALKTAKEMLEYLQLTQ